MGACSSTSTVTDIHCWTEIAQVPSSTPQKTTPSSARATAPSPLNHHYNNPNSPIRKPSIICNGLGVQKACVPE
ncbi:hypothetical protein AAC387_Pa04g2098 [Persea americana]